MNTLIYLASPYTQKDHDIRQQRFEDAVRAAAWLMKSTGKPVFCPIAHSHYIDIEFGAPENGEFWKAQDAPYLEAASELVVLQINGWDQSAGVNHEFERAQERGIPITFMSKSVGSGQSYLLHPIETKKAQQAYSPVTLEAHGLVMGNRGKDYGHPREDFSRTGRIWGGILSEWAKETNGEAPVPPEIVGLCMIGVKLSRQVNRPKRDNMTDAAGYAETVQMCVEAAP